jgi:hypothetical protein
MGSGRAARRDELKDRRVVVVDDDERWDEGFNA